MTRQEKEKLLIGKNVSGSVCVGNKKSCVTVESKMETKKPFNVKEPFHHRLN
jgi:hypothetical protein